MAKANTAKKPASVEAKTQPADAGVLYVRDRLVIDKPRVHELRDSAGKVQTFTFADRHQDVPVPTDMALPLVHNDGFEVRRNLDDESPLKPMARDSESAVLQADETIAKYTELKRSALIHRVTRLGYSVNEKIVTDNELISVLMGGIKDDDESLEVDEDEIQSTVIPAAILTQEQVEKGL